jgi:tetratricopeptide (TPR) repeat protein
MMTTLKQRGYAAVQARKLVEAAECFSKALEETPDDAQVRTWLGQTLCALGRRDEGVAYLRKVGQHFVDEARISGNIGPVLEITAQLQQWTDFPGALELGGEAVQINASDFRAFQLLAVSCSQLNKKAEAVDAARRALELAPENTMLQVFLGSLEADAGQNDTARIRLEKALGHGLSAREQFRAHKELARVLDKLGQYDQVFPHLHASAGLSGSLPEYSQQDAALLPNLVKANKASFDRELLARWSGTSFPDQAAPVFLIGFLRSGTTLSQEVLAAHPDVFVADEADFVWATQRELHQMDSSNAGTAEKLRKLDVHGIMHLREFYWNRVRGRFGSDVGQRMFVDKFTLNTIDLGLINCIFPDAKVVFVMRDPRDVCFSCFMQLMVPTPATVHFLSWPETAAFYAQVMDWWMHIRQQMTLPFIEFRYEDAVTQFETTYRKVFDFLGLPWDPAVVDFHQRAAAKFIASPSRNQVTQPLYSSSLARWRRFEPEFAPVSNVLRPFIDAFEYEPS